jgi:hypothetical protein
MQFFINKFREGVTVKQSLVIASLILAATSVILSQTSAGKKQNGTKAKDDAAIRQIFENRAEIFKHYSQNVDWENAFGRRKKGLVEVQQFLNERVNATLEKAVRTPLEIKVTFIRPDVAMVDEYWRLVGQTDGPGGATLPERNGRTTYILQKESGKWLVVIQRIADLRK